MSDWSRGIALSILASIIGGVSKLAIRKSWLIVQEDDNDDDSNDSGGGGGVGGDDSELANNHSKNRKSTEDTAVTTSCDTAELIVADDEEAKSPPPSPQKDFVVEDNDTNIKKKNNVTDYELSSRQRRKNYRKSIALRYSGMFGMTFLNPACCVVAMNYASPSILAPFSGLTLVWVVLFSQPTLGEKPTSSQLIASSLIIMGQMIVAIFGDHTNDDGVTIDDVVRMLLKYA